MGKIVYHGTLSDEPPHSYGMPFHVGTERAAWDRLDDEVSHGVDLDSAAIIRGTIHKYELSDTAPTSKVLRQDPMFYDDEGMAVPETRTDKIYPYENKREDVGSTSFVVPHTFVGTHVKHLGTQFEGVLAVNPDVSKAVSAMSGGKTSF